MSEQNKNLVRRWFEEVWNQGRLSAIPELYIQSGRAHGFPDPDAVINSAEEFAENCKAFRQAFPDIRIVVDGLGFPATSKKVGVSGSSFLICGNGQILEGWNYMDLTRMRLQLQGKL
jgi:SnoaL-like polyketide cyclase